MISEAKELDIDEVMDVDNCAFTTLNELKLQIYAVKGGHEKLEEKIKSIEQSLKRVKDSAKQENYKLASGISLIALCKYEEALEALNDIKSKKIAKFYIGKCYQEMGVYDKAIDCFEHSASKTLTETDYLPQYEIAATKRKSGDLEGAKKACGDILKVVTNDADIFYQLGHCLDDIGEKDEALDMYEKALDVDPDHTPALFRKAYNYDLQNMDEEAIDLYEQCNQLTIKYLSSFMNLGILYEDKGEYKKAIDCYESVLKTDPNNLRAQMYRKDADMSLCMYYDENVPKRHDKTQDVLSIPISDFELSVRSRNCLEKMFISTLGDLTKVSEHDLLSYKNFGETSLYEIRNILKQKGLRLGQSLEKAPDGENGIIAEFKPESEENADNELEETNAEVEPIEDEKIEDVGDAIDEDDIIEDEAEIEEEEEEDDDDVEVEVADEDEE